MHEQVEKERIVGMGVEAVVDITNESVNATEG